MGAGHARRDCRYGDDLGLVAAAPRLSTPARGEGRPGDRRSRVIGRIVERPSQLPAATGQVAVLRFVRLEMAAGWVSS